MTTEDYVQKAVEELGLSELPEEERAAALDSLEQRFSEVVVNTAFGALSEEQRHRFSEALEKGEEAERLVSELTAEVPGLDEAIRQALEDEYELVRLGMTGA